MNNLNKYIKILYLNVFFTQMSSTKLIGKTTYEALYVNQTRRILKKRKRIIKQRNHIRRNRNTTQQSF